MIWRALAPPADTPARTVQAGAQAQLWHEELTDGRTSRVSTAASNSSANSNGVTTLDTPFADPDTEALRLKVNEMVATMRR